MSEVRCHYCGKQMPLEQARPRGQSFRGFTCNDCYWRRLKWSMLILPAVVVIVLLFAWLCQR